MSTSKVAIPIDGPVASGKTTVGRALARKLGIAYLDTGIMYRAVTWLALDKNISASDRDGLASLADTLRINVDDDIGNSVEINGISLKDELVEPRIVDNVSEISKQECIRLALVSQQRSLASTRDIVMVGRDIGTIVLPDADLKIYITASLSIRARRRWLELKDKGVKVNYSQIVDSIKKRDLIDSNRTNSPLAIAQDAWEINTDNLGVKQVTELIIQKLRDTTPNIPIIEPI
ncbi:MAG: (d)CMP kinase [Chloroflexota bacterium]|nr:(d)CMP kinase [Chloroflexota bacterium]